MKRLILLSTVLFSILTLNAQSWLEFTPAQTTEPKYDLITSTDSLVKFNVNIPGLFETEIDSFYRVQIKNHSRMDSAGLPEMPIVSFLIAIPECDSVKLNLTLMDSISFSDYNVYPAPELVPDTTPGGAIALVEQFTYNRSAYETDAMFPGYIGEAVDKGAIRAQNVVRVLLYPVQFNPVKKTIMAYSDIEVSLSFYNSNGNIQQDVGIFNEVVGNTLINYQSNGLNASVSCGAGLENSGNWYYVDSLPNQRIDSACDYVIITHDSLYYTEAGQEAIDSLAAHRANFNGFDVAIITTKTIKDDILPVYLDEFEKIKKLIENTYNSNNANHTYDGKLAYVNLFGDAFFGNDPFDICIPTYLEGYDVYFTQLTWDSINGQIEYDIYPDLMIGRCSVDDTTQVKNVVQKILNFEPYTYDWKNNFYSVIGVANTGEYIKARAGMIKLAEIIQVDSAFLSFNYDYTYSMPDWDTIPYTYPDNTPILNRLAKGNRHFLYTGHGAYYGVGILDYSDLNSSHDNKLFFMFLQACTTGPFHAYDDCMTEEFLSADSSRGAIACIGSSQYVLLYNFYEYLTLYESLFQNYSHVIGENFLEAKIRWVPTTASNLFPVNRYNLFGDPALNLLYENTDTIYPDLCVKKNHITFSPEYPIHGDTVKIEAIIKNNLCNNVSDTFFVSCYAINMADSVLKWIGNKTVNGLNGYFEIVNFTWFTSDLSLYDYKFDILINIDTSNSVQELIEDNNTNSNILKIYSYNNDLKINNPYINNSHPVSFDLYENYNGEEIVFGEKVISSSGEIISVNSGETKGYTSIGNLTNNQNYQILQVNFQDTATLLKSIGNPAWNYELPECSVVRGPVISDLDNDGFEEILLLVMASEPWYQNYETKLICLNHNGNLRWDYDFTEFFIYSPLIYDNINKTIIMMNRHAFSKIYFMNENETQDSIIIADSILLPDFYKIINRPIIADLNKNGNLDMVFTCYDIYTSNCYLKVLDLTDTNFQTKLIDNTLLNSDPIISDIDNNGTNDIICVQNNGILILDYNLDTLNFINEPDLVISELVSGDFNNDGFNDIVCQIVENLNEYYLKIYDYEGNDLFTAPIAPKLDACWISDINEDGSNDIIYSYRDNLYVIDVPNAGSSIGWPGQHGNVRNTGVLEHPAYFAPSGDTVYWMNTISLAGDNIVPTGSTVIIKPGTRIVAHDSASLIIYGNLITEGTEDFPITFSADINNSEAGYWQGITIKNHSFGKIKYCKISDAEIGILFEDNNQTDISNCYLNNNIEGIGCKSSSTVIRGNTIVENSIGIGSYDNATPVLCDLITEDPFRNGIINNDTGILVDKARMCIDYGYNDIYCDPVDDEYYIKYNYEPKPYSIKARKNYWGTTVLINIIAHLEPPLSFSIDPVCSQQNTGGYKDSDIQYENLRSAFYAMNEGEHETAETLFKQVITSWPETDFSFVAISGMFSNNYQAGGSWYSYEQYLDQLSLDSTFSDDFFKHIFCYQNLSLRERGEYAQAISNYELIVLNDPAYNDSVYAVIDIGNTYEEAGNYKSSLGQLSYLIPESRAKHVKKTVDLLLSLRPDNNNVKNQLENDFSITGIIPNPFRNETTVFFKTPYTCNIRFKVYDATGKIIQSEQTGNTTEGNHEYILQMPEEIPGIYYIALVANGKQVSVKKIVVN